MMKKTLIAASLMLLLMLSGCSFKIQKDSIYIPADKVRAVELQKEFLGEDNITTYRKKVVDDEKNKEEICERLRSLPIKKAPNNQPNPISELPMIIILQGEKDHHLILTKEMAYYDKIAYEYTKDGVFEEFLALYDELDYEESVTEPKPY
jgi:hypothetical protein